MSHTIAHPAALDSFVTIRERFSRLALPVWRFGADGALVAPPGEPAPAGLWLRSRYIERSIAAHAARWLSDPEPAECELYPGAWIIPIVDQHRRRRGGLSVVLALCPEALGAEEFLAGCQSASLDAASARTSLAPYAVHQPSAIGRTAEMARWMHDDVAVRARSRDEIAQLSRQLTESYEEFSLLFKLGQSMNEIENPHRFVAMVCDELFATLSFRWIAVRLTPEARDARGVAGRLFLAGSIPCPRPEFDRFAMQQMAMLSTDQRLILSGDRAGPAASDGSQVLAHPIVRESRVMGVLLAGGKQGDDTQVSTVDMKLLDAAAGYLGVLLDNACLYDDQQATFMGTLEALTSAIDAKDPYTCGHSHRVAMLASALAEAHGMDEDHCERVRVAGLVHDIGKIGVPEAVLCKAGKLTDDEFAAIKKHPEIGYRILRDIPQFEDVLPGVLNHHERWDGRGYPLGLKGDAIPLMARIIGLVDAFDAMSSTRTYRAAMSRERVMEEIRRGAGAQFDPSLAEAFLRVDLARFDEMIEENDRRAPAETPAALLPESAPPRTAQRGEAA